MALYRKIFAFLFVALSASLFLVISIPAKAQLSPDWKLCVEGEPDEGIPACTRIIRAGNATATNLSIAYQNRGHLYGVKKDYDSAIQDASEAVRINPKNAQAWTNRGGYYANKKQYDRAISDHTEAIRLDPNQPDAWYNRGNVFEITGEKQKAIADYRQALRVNPKDKDAVRGLENLGEKP